LIATGVVRRRIARYGIEIGATLPSVTGYPLHYRSSFFAAADGCVIYRVVSGSCAACRLEEPLWRRATWAGAGAGCEIVLLTPDLEAAPYPAPSLVPQIQWVPLDWARSVRLAMTPTTIATVNRQIVWAYQGELDPGHFAALERRLEQWPGK